MIEVPKYVAEAIEKLYENGGKGYMVGGCVRDAIMGLVPADYDIATDRTPEAVKKIFDKTIDTGIKHGTVTVLCPDGQIEVTTYRTESEYEKNRRPKSVLFISNLEEDLKRRDFTINAMAYNKRDGLVDLFGGQADIEAKIIRAVGDPDLRFCEDALRMLRAVRFCATLGFSLDNKTKAAIIKNAGLIECISGERIRIELEKILMSDRPEYISMLNTTGLLEFIMPELAICFKTGQKTKYHIHDVGEHTLRAIKVTPKDLVLRWAMLFHDIGKPEVKTTDEFGVDHFFYHAKKGAELSAQVMNRLKFSNDLKHQIAILVGEHDTQIPAEKKDMKPLISRIGKELFAKLLIIKRADLAAKDKEECAARMKEIDRAESVFREILENSEPLFIKDLAVDGEEIRGLGYQGRGIGEALMRLLEHVFEAPEDNKKDLLLSLIKR